MQQITVIGSGTMGNGIAHVFAQYGYPVCLYDIHDEALTSARKAITLNLDRQLTKQTITVEEKEAILGKITTLSDLKEATQHAHLVIEAVTENYAVKQQLFRQLDDICSKKTILASNTSSISITKLAANTLRPDKVIGMHFMNPVPIMPLVEVINGYQTATNTTKTIVELTKRINKKSVIVNDYPGFIANRILMPMINEAIFSLYERIAGVEEIDTVMKLGMSHPMGPLQLADFIGLDVCLAILEVLYHGFGNPKYAPCPLLVKMVHAKQLGKKTGIGFYDYRKKGQGLIVAEQFLNSMDIGR